MKQKRTSAVRSTPIKVVVVTLDSHLGGVMKEARASLGKSLPGLELCMHAATDWEADPASLEACCEDIASGDIIVVTMIFLEHQINAVLPALVARRDHCDAMICCMSAAEIMKQTRMGKFSMDGEATGPIALLKRLRGKSNKSGKGAGAQQASILRQLPRILRFIPGTAQDVRAYFLTLQYWLAASEENIRQMICFLIDRYADGPREVLRGSLKVAAPIEYPETGVYHPRMKGRISDKSSALPRSKAKQQGRVGLLVMRSYALAGNTAHYDAVIEGLEARGYQVVTAFASGLDARPAVETFFKNNGKATVDAVVSLTGFSLVGGPAYNDAGAAEAMLADLDVPYIAAQPLEFQSVKRWEDSEQGLTPIEATMMVAIPELEGATGPMIFGGRDEDGADDMSPHQERIDTLVARVDRLVQLRHQARAERKLAVVLFNFPPNGGNTGTAANLAVFGSLYNTLQRLAEEGYTVDLPASVDALREAVTEGNALQYGAYANVADTVDVDDYVRHEPHLADIEAQWGPAPGKQLSDGRRLFILGANFGNIFVGVQPAFGWEGDPMRLLFEQGFAPTHAFSAFYHYLKNQFGASAVLHYGTHGALEFMPGKQVGMSGACWPDRLIGDLPHFYLYAANNPSEGLLAKRRAAATLVTYMTPPVTQADLYRGLVELKESIEAWRRRDDNEQKACAEQAALIQAQAAALDMAVLEPLWDHQSAETIEALRRELLELETTLIPYGLHEVGTPTPTAQRADLLRSVAAASYELELEEGLLQSLVDGAPVAKLAKLHPHIDAEVLDALAEVGRQLADNQELSSLVHALDAGFVRPAPGGDLLRNPDVLPTGRNLHGFDPYCLPSAFAVREGKAQAEMLLSRHVDEGNALPESVALVLWGSDNMKNEGSPIAQALALMGARPRRDGYGRLCGAELIPLEELGRPRVDVVITLSGIFRDLLPLQTRMLAEAAFLAASAEEDSEQNYVRRHALAHMAKHDCDIETASLRVFSNAEGAYGSNVNLLVDSSRWEEEDELAEAYTKRKCFAYGRDGQPAQQSELLEDVLGGVELAYQNLESVELGVTTVDHYFDTLGGISRAVQRASGKDVPVYISDQTTATGKVRTLSEQLDLESRSRMLNPKWYESMLQHGYEGVRSIETHVTNTVGWSATTGQVAPWVYQQLSETFILDEDMRKRLAELNPTASVKVAHRLLEAHERQYWHPDESTLNALRQAGEDLEDWLEGVSPEVAA
ncbi:MAG: magnesium chelatase subunit H [Pseudomonadota bacterium]